MDPVQGSSTTFNAQLETLRSVAKTMCIKTKKSTLLEHILVINPNGLQ